MKFLDLREFAEHMRITGDSQGCDFADEILSLLDIEAEVAEPFYTLCDNLDHYAPDLKGKPEKQLEWIGDRSHLLDELKEKFEQHGYTEGDVDDRLAEVLDTLATAEDTLRKRGHWQDGEFIDALQELAERAGYDL